LHHSPNTAAINVPEILKSAPNSVENNDRTHCLRRRPNEKRRNLTATALKF
jgi:hypothetical protein